MQSKKICLISFTERFVKKPQQCLGTVAKILCSGIITDVTALRVRIPRRDRPKIKNLLRKFDISNVVVNLSDPAMLSLFLPVSI